MSILIGILGLGFLVFIHEAGHFFTARAVGMSPRKFYIGFPPPLFRVRRNNIEYGIGTIPLGGYVKIPGMHRPAPSDLDAHFGRAVAEESELIGPLEHVKRRLTEGDMEGARALLDGARDLLHARVAGREREELAGGQGAVQHGGGRADERDDHPVVG